MTDHNELTEQAAQRDNVIELVMQVAAERDELRAENERLKTELADAASMWSRNLSDASELEHGIRDALRGLDSDLGDDATLPARVDELHESYLDTVRVGGEYVGKIDRLTVERDQLQVRVNAALAVCDAGEWQATRWEQPFPIPTWVLDVRAALQGDHTREPEKPFGVQLMEEGMRMSLRDAEERDDASEPDPSGRWTGNVLGPFAEHDLDDYSPNGTDDDSVVNGD